MCISIQDNLSTTDPTSELHNPNMTSTKKLHLSMPDQTTYRHYIRALFIFPFPDISPAGDALRGLSGGLSLALLHYPHLAGSLVTNPAMGFLEAAYPDPLPPNVGDIMLYPNHEHVADPEMDLHVMEREGFPPAMPQSTVFPFLF